MNRIVEEKARTTVNSFERIELFPEDTFRGLARCPASPSQA